MSVYAFDPQYIAQQKREGSARARESGSERSVRTGAGAKRPAHQSPTQSSTTRPIAPRATAEGEARGERALRGHARARRSESQPSHLEFGGQSGRTVVVRARRGGPARLVRGRRAALFAKTVKLAQPASIRDVRESWRPGLAIGRARERAPRADLLDVDGLGLRVRRRLGIVGARSGRARGREVEVE